MAQRIETKLICDLTGAEADETIEFGFEGKSYRIDLTKQYADAFRDIMADYVNASAVVGKSADRRTRGSGAPRANRDQTRAVREWAQKNGYNVSTRGRIPVEVQQAFDQAHAGSHLAAVG